MTKTYFHIICFLFSTILISCDPASKKDDWKQNLNTELHAWIDQWHQNAANANLNEYIGAMSDSGVFIGTDPSERWATSEFGAFCKPYFDSGKTWEFHPVQRFIFISEDGNTAWFDELLDTKLGLCRGSGVLQKKNGYWKLEQYVLSPTIPNEMIKEVVKQKQVLDSTFIRALKEKSQ